MASKTRQPKAPDLFEFLKNVPALIESRRAKEKSKPTEQRYLPKVFGELGITPSQLEKHFRAPRQQKEASRRLMMEIARRASVADLQAHRLAVTLRWAADRVVQPSEFAMCLELELRDLFHKWRKQRRAIAKSHKDAEERKHLLHAGDALVAMLAN